MQTITDNLTITIPEGFLSGKPAEKLEDFNRRAAEFNSDRQTLQLDSLGNDIDRMKVEIGELEQWQRVVRRRRLELGRLGLTLCEQRESLLTALQEDCRVGLEKAESRHESAINATVKQLVAAGIGPRPNASVQAGEIQMRHRAGESQAVQAARAALENAKVAREMAFRAGDSHDALREHFRGEIDLIIQLFGAW
jgi:hypothetical protein